MLLFFSTSEKKMYKVNTEGLYGNREAFSIVLNGGSKSVLHCFYLHSIDLN